MKTMQALFLLLVPKVLGAELKENSKMDWEKRIDLISKQYFKVVPFFGAFSKTLFKTIKESNERLMTSTTMTSNTGESWIRIS